MNIARNNMQEAGLAGLVHGRTILLQEVGPRDGLQNESIILAPQMRVWLIERLGETGLTRIQIGSFVNPKKVPQMAGTDEVWRSLKKKAGIRYSVLVLNEPGLRKAIEQAIPHVEIYVSASETHSMRNSGMSLSAAMSAAGRMIRMAVDAGMGVTAGVMCAFGCFFEGQVPAARVAEMAVVFDSLGATEIALADTAGLGDPKSVRMVMEAVLAHNLTAHPALHLHDTRGMAALNLSVALELGVCRFDSSLGGLGGCPFIPGAAGNISTEFAVEMLEARGLATGVQPAMVRTITMDLLEILRENAPGAQVT